MKTIQLTAETPSVHELFEMAQTGTVVVETQNGNFFMITTIDPFDTEVELLRKNHRFLTMLDDFKREEETIPLEQAERELR